MSRFRPRRKAVKSARLHGAWANYTRDEMFGWSPDKWWLTLDDGPWVSLSKADGYWQIHVSMQALPADQRSAEGDPFLRLSIDEETLVKREPSGSPAPQSVELRVEEAARQIWARSTGLRDFKTWEAVPGLFKSGYRRAATEWLGRSRLYRLVARPPSGITDRRRSRIRGR